MDEPTRRNNGANGAKGGNGATGLGLDEGARVQGEVAAALTATGRPALRRLDVSASKGRVVLRGRVTSYFLKQVAQTAALAVPAVDEVLNEVEVVAPR